MKRVLLIQPIFPAAKKSLNHKNYLPIGLLKLAAWQKSLGNVVSLSFGMPTYDFAPDEVYITSLFTYWSRHVKIAVEQVRSSYPNAKITVGGIYASLQPDHCLSFTGCDEVYVGVHPEAETYHPDYTLINTNIQVIHATRGCIRKCRFCGTHIIEPEFTAKRSVASEISKRLVVFYDNNFLANPHIVDVLEELADLRVNGRHISCECQSGFDGRILRKKPSLAKLLKSAYFRYPRIAWDSGVNDAPKVHSEISILKDAGYSLQDIQVFMLFNHQLCPDELMEKVEFCFNWGVQVSDCRYRPLDLYFDGYNPRKSSQSKDEYYIHPGWSDRDIRLLRRTVRKNNICLRYRIPRERYSQKLERFTRYRKRSMLSNLGITSTTLSATELDAINTKWICQKQTDSDRKQ